MSLPGVEGNSPIFADHRFAAVPTKIGTVPKKKTDALATGTSMRAAARYFGRRIKVPQPAIRQKRP